VGAILTPGYSIAPNIDDSIAETIRTRWQARCADRIADDGHTLTADPVDPTFEQPRRNMMSVGDQRVSQ
jgi:hypothetical protein